MRTKVTEHGVLNPEGWLEGIDEVEIQKTHNMIIVMPVQADDPRVVCAVRTSAMPPVSCCAHSARHSVVMNGCTNLMQSDLDKTRQHMLIVVCVALKRLSPMARTNQKGG